MLHYILFIVLLCLLIRDFAKTTILVAALACWLSLFVDPLDSVDNLYLTLSLLISLLGILKYHKQFGKLPFLWCGIPVLLSYSITKNVHGFHSKQYLVLIARYVFPCILYCVLNCRERVSLYVKYASTFLLLAVAYCFIEESISANPIMHWCENNQSSFTWLIDRTESRFGVKRAQSFFADVVPFGISAAYTFILLFIFQRDRNQIMQKKWRRILLVLLPICVFMTGTRSVIMCFLLASVSLLTVTTIKRYRFQLLIFALFIALFMGSYLGSIYDSIFVDSAELGGSSSDMREGQWDIAFFYMAQDFWVGNGIGFTGNLLAQGGVAGLFGAEGMWLPIMMDTGMLGVIGVFISFIIGLMSILYRKKYNLIWIWASFLLLKTITTGVGVEPTYYEVILVVLFRYLQFNEYPKNKIYDFNNNSSL